MESAPVQQRSKIKQASRLFRVTGRPGSPPPELLGYEHKSLFALLGMALLCQTEPTNMLPVAVPESFFHSAVITGPYASIGFAGGVLFSPSDFRALADRLPLRRNTM